MNKKVVVMGLLCSLFFTTPTFATQVSINDDNSVDANYDAEYDGTTDVSGNHSTNISDEESSSGSNAHLNNSSESSSQEPDYTKAQEDAIKERQEIHDTLYELMSETELDHAVTNGEYAGMLQYGNQKVPAATLEKILDNYEKYLKNLKVNKKNATALDKALDGHEALNHIKDAKKDFLKLTKKQQEDAKLAISEKTGKKIIDKEKTIPYNPTTTTPTVWKAGLKSSDATIPVRTDLVNDGIWDSNTYTGIIQTLKNYKSNAMEDYLEVSTIRDYHISKVQKDYIEQVDYTPSDDDEIVSYWTLISHSTGQKYNYETHTSNTTFYDVPPGEYTLKVKQKVVERKSIRLYYDIRDYMFDTATQTILAYHAVSVTGGNGGNYVDIDVSEKEKWIEQTDADFVVTEQGIETDSGVERIK